MTSNGVADALETLTNDDPSYDELVSLYNELRSDTPRSAERAVSQWALAQVIGELVDYLDFVEAELEKSVGISRVAERERLLESFEEPRGKDAVERVNRVMRQWKSMKLYTRDEGVPALRP